MYFNLMSKHCNITKLHEIKCYLKCLYKANFPYSDVIWHLFRARILKNEFFIHSICQTVDFFHWWGKRNRWYACYFHRPNKFLFVVLFQILSEKMVLFPFRKCIITQQKIFSLELSYVESKWYKIWTELQITLWVW